MAGETISSNEFASSKRVKICPDALLGWISALMITLASRTAPSTSLLTPSSARAVLRFVRDPFGFRLGRFSLLPFENLQQVHSRRPAHLFAEESR
jgi:hypothetical protein